jgi:hypothetical protein
MRPTSIALREASRTVTTLLVLGVCTGCPEGGGGTSGANGSPVLNYSDVDARYWLTAPIEDNVATVNFTVVEFSIEPALPAGLSFDEQDGTISGTPAELLPRTSFTVTADSGAGSQAERLLWIEVVDAVAPSGLVYDPNPIIAYPETPLGSLPTLVGHAQGFSVSPPLPVGLTLDGQTGVIGGACYGPLGTTFHQVTATNPIGQTQAVVEVSMRPTLDFRGLLVASADDGSVAFQVRRGVGFATVDVETCGGASTVAAACTYDGRGVYAACSDGLLRLFRRDPRAGFVERPVELGAVGDVRELATTPDDRLIAAGDGLVVRYVIEAGGSVCCGEQVAGPADPTAMALTSGSIEFLVVAESYPARVWIYDLEPELALRGPPCDLGADDFVTGLAASARDEAVYASTNRYTIGQGLQGRLRSLHVASPGEINAGSDPLVAFQDIALGGRLSDVGFLPDSFGSIAVADAQQGVLHSYEIRGQSGALDLGSHETLLVGGHPERLLVVPELYGPSTVFVLDQQAAEVCGYALSGWAGTPAGLRSRSRTRALPRDFVPLRGEPEGTALTTAIVTSALDSTVTVLHSAIGLPEAFAASTQGPVPTGASPVDVIASPKRSAVYTADEGSATVSVFDLDPATRHLAAVETEALPPGSLPRSLALMPGSRFLYVADGSGRILVLAVDPADGSLTASTLAPVPGSASSVVARTDALGRFLFLVQPDAGLVSTFRIDAGDGTPTFVGATNALARPVDLWLPDDGRFAYALDAQTSRVLALEIVSDGSLLATGSTFAAGAAPTRLALGWPAIAGQGALFHTLVALDPGSSTGWPMRRHSITGALSPETAQGLSAPIALPSGALSLASFSDSTAGLLVTRDDGAAAQLRVFHYDTPPPSLIEATPVPIGRGPLGLTTYPTDAGHSP